MIGQDLAADVLKRAVRSGKITHAYLFTGPEGVGKTTGALAFAAALNCESPTPEGDACGTCISCHMVDSMGHPDVEIIRPAGAVTKIDQMREMRRSTQYAPIKGRFRVVIVEQADTMNDDSSNSILKTLEEPPEYLILILLSRNPSLLLQTIRSRCMRLRFANVAADVVTRALIERYQAREDQAEFLAAYSEGRPGIAVGLLSNEAFAEFRSRVIELASRIRQNKLPAALRVSEEFQKLTTGDKEDNQGKRVAIRMAIDSLILIYRDLLSLVISRDSAQLINSDIRDTLASLPADSESISHGIDTLLWARRALEGNANIQLLSDVLMMRLMR